MIVLFVLLVGCYAGQSFVWLFGCLFVYLLYGIYKKKCLLIIALVGILVAGLRGCLFVWLLV
jgi:hypothetical protein